MESFRDIEGLYAMGGYFGNGLTGRMMSGGFNGAMHGRDSESFFRGMLSGVVPSDLGFTNAFNNNALANAGINVARDGIRGAMINGKEGAKLNIGAGLVHNGFGHAFGFISSGFNAPKFNDGAWHYNVKFLPGAAAITLGNVVSYNQPLLTNCGAGQNYLKWQYDHELDHVGDQSALGLAYFPAHIPSQWIGGQFFGPDYAFMEQVPYMNNHPYTSSPHFRR